MEKERQTWADIYISSTFRIPGSSFQSLIYNICWRDLEEAANWLLDFSDTVVYIQRRGKV